ncbi:MAG: 6-carboxytetrahydropterin synthase [Gemmatimonadetes bacterium]|nr:6-carboxytetrahydropterin synthase [Gemmatimonadota bacterium]
MPQYLLSADVSFSAAHTLPGVPLCERFHGHDWKIRLTVTVAAENLTNGMGLDFRIIQQIGEDAVSDFDHTYLNDLEPFKTDPPTAENIARVLSDRTSLLLAEQAPTAKLTEIEVWETEQYRVVYRPE